MARKTGAPEMDEVEITPEMIEAGLEELYKHPVMEPDDGTMREAVKCVFKRMMASRRLSRRTADGTGQSAS